MIKNTKIGRQEKVESEIKNPRDLFDHGFKALERQEYRTAKNYLEKYFEVDSNHPEVCFSLFFINVQLEDYVNAFTYLTYFNNFLDKENNLFNLQDYNFYIYLLSFLIDLPKEYKEFAKGLTLEDILSPLDGQNDSVINLINKAKTYAFRQNFNLARKQLKDKINTQDIANVIDILMLSLIRGVETIKGNQVRYVYELATMKDYREIKKYLENIQKLHNLSMYEAGVLSITRALIKVKEQGIIPEKIVTNTNNTFSAIHNRDYNHALYLATMYNKKREKTTDDTLCLLLKEINSEINLLLMTNIPNSNNQLLDYSNINEDIQRLKLVPKTN